MNIVGCVQLDVGEISENKELTGINYVPEVVEVLKHAHLPHLADFYHKKERQRNQAYNVASLCYPLNLEDTLDQYWANERNHVE